MTDGDVPRHLSCVITTRATLTHSLGLTSVSLSLLQGLVIASISDLARPADKISSSQTAALAATGLIWSRYSLVIIPKNYSLFSVNIFVAITNLYQLYRVQQNQRSSETT